jgi:hypothetical protein
MRAGVATLVVACQVVREQEVTAAGVHLDAGAQVQRWFEQGRMPEGLPEHPGATLGEQSLVREVRARPDPEVARRGATLVAENDARQERERRRRVLGGTVPVDMWPTGDMAPWWNRGRYLNVVKRVVEFPRAHQFVGDVECSRRAQRGIAPGQLTPRSEPEIGTGATGPLVRRDTSEEVVDLAVRGLEKVFGHDAGDDHVPRVSEMP